MILRSREVTYNLDSDILDGYIVYDTESDNKFIVIADFKHVVQIYSWEQLELLYHIPGDGYHDIKPKMGGRYYNSRCFMAQHPDWRFSNHFFCWGYHFDIFDLHKGLNSNNIFYQALKPLNDKEIDL